MIAIRVAGGGGKNFIATLLSKYYNTNNFMYYDNYVNEYLFYNKVYLSNDQNLKNIYWNNLKWNIISGIKIDTPKILLYHNLKENDPNIIRNNIKEKFNIFIDNENDLNFIIKLDYIKSKSIKQFLVFDDSDESKNILALNPTLEAKKLKYNFGIQRNDVIKNFLILINDKFLYEEWIDIWKKYCIFIKQFPYHYLFSGTTLAYIQNWILDNMTWDLFNTNTFFNFIQDNNKQYQNRIKIKKLIKSELNEINQARELQKQNGMILHEINYRDLFFDLKPTNTVLDNYMSEIKDYTERNVNLINDYESFYGKIL